MSNKFQIIVLNNIKHSDSGLVVQCYSELHGRLSLYLRGGNRNKSALAMLHHLAIVDIVTEAPKFKSNNSIANIKEISTAYPLLEIRTKVQKSAIAIFITELLIKIIKEVEPNIQLYNYLSSSIKLLEHIQDGSNNFHLYFLVHLSKILGFMPLNDYNTNKPIFDVSTASFSSLKPKNMPYFLEEESILLAHILNINATDIATIKCSGALRNSFSLQMTNYLCHHLGCNIEIKSLDVLHNVFK